MSSFEDDIVRKYVNSLSHEGLLELYKKYKNDDVFYYKENISHDLAIYLIEQDISTIDYLHQLLSIAEIKHYIATKQDIDEYVYWLAKPILENCDKEYIINFYIKYSNFVSYSVFEDYFNELELSDVTDELALAVIKQGFYINKNTPIVDYTLNRIKEDVNLLVKFLPHGVHESFVYYMVNTDVEYKDKITFELFEKLHAISNRYAYYYLTQALKFGYYEILNLDNRFISSLYDPTYGEHINDIKFDKLKFEVDIQRLVRQHKNLKYETVKDHISLYKYWFLKF